MTYQIGSLGQVVRQVQTKVGVTADGVFGKATAAAVKAWQSASHLSADGIVGPITLAAMGLVPAPVVSPPAPVETPAPVNPGTQDDDLAYGVMRLGIILIGIKEATGNNDGQFVEMLQAWIDGDDSDDGKGWMHDAAWCAAFTTWRIWITAAMQGKQFNFLKSASSSSIYDWGKSKNLLLGAPIMGCVGLMKGDGGAGDGRSHHHTFQVETVDMVAGVVHGLDGNWSNQVMRTTHNIADCDFVAII